VLHTLDNFVITVDLHVGLSEQSGSSAQTKKLVVGEDGCTPTEGVSRLVSRKLVLFYDQVRYLASVDR